MNYLLALLFLICLSFTTIPALATSPVPNHEKCLVEGSLVEVHTENDNQLYIGDLFINSSRKIGIVGDTNGKPPANCSDIVGKTLTDISLDQSQNPYSVNQKIRGEIGLYTTTSNLLSARNITSIKNYTVQETVRKFITYPLVLILIIGVILASRVSSRRNTKAK